MTKKRREIIVDLANNFQSVTNFFPVIIVTGPIGIGKSEFTKDLVEHLQTNKKIDAVINFNFDVDNDYLCRFLKTISIHFPDSDYDTVKYNFDETVFNDSRLNDLLFQIQDTSPEYHQNISEYLKLIFYPSINKTTDIKAESDINAILNKVLDKKGDIRLISDNGRVAAESLIVDLMNLFYPITNEFSNHEKYLEQLKSPIKILLNFDNFDKISYSIFKWLNDYCLPVCMEGKFSNFVTYNFQNNNSGLLISQFFEFYFLVSNRINPLKIEELDYFNKLLPKTRHISLLPLSLDETIDYISKFNLKTKKPVNELHNISYGIPYFIDLWVEYFNIAETNEEQSLINHKICEKIFDGKTDEQIDALRSAAYLELFDEEALRCFPQLRNIYREAYTFINFVNDISSLENNKLFIRNPFKEIIKDSTKHSSPKTADNLEKISKLYYDVRKNYKRISNSDFNVIRSFAYFNYFDIDVALERAFESDAPLAKTFIKNYPDYFDKNFYAYRLKDEHRDKLQQINRLIDFDKFDDKKKLIDKLWHEYSIELNEEIATLEVKLEKLKVEFEEFNGNPDNKKNYYEEHQRIFIEKENELITIRKKIGDYSPSKNVTSAIINYTAGIVAFLASYFFPDIFSTPDNHSSIVIIQYILYLLSSVFILAGFYYIRKIIRLIAKKNEIKILEEQLNVVQNEKEEHQSYMTKFRESNNNWQKRYQEITDQMKVISSRINELKEKLKYSFKK